MPSPTTDVQMTERAARRIAHILKSEAEGAKLRVSVKGGGCSGFQYTFDVDTVSAADDALVIRDGVEVLIDSVSLPFLKGSEIDFVDDLMGQAFKIHNPNATASCGCGTSFSI